MGGDYPTYLDPAVLFVPDRPSNKRLPVAPPPTLP